MKREADSADVWKHFSEGNAGEMGGDAGQMGDAVARYGGDGYGVLRTKCVIIFLTDSHGEGFTELTGDAIVLRAVSAVELYDDLLG